MLRNYLSAALANLARNWLYASITIFGLAAGFAAAILIGLYVRDEYSFERFIPGYQDVYRVQLDLALPGQKLQQMDVSLGSVAANFAADFPQVQYVARLAPSSQLMGSDRPRAVDAVAWADPDFFRVIPYPVLAGDPVAALHNPDGVVLTRSMARKYFGEDAPIGRTLLFSPGDNAGGPAGNGPHPMRVLAVLKDIPSETHLNVQIFASGRAAWSPQTYEDAHPNPFDISYLTYVRLKPGSSPDRVRAQLRAFDNRHYRGTTAGSQSAQYYRLFTLKDIHFAAHNNGGIVRPPGDRAVDSGIAAVGVLIILIAAINFVTLMTARAARRAVEVGVRKVVGARRIDLVVQFMGEALIYVLTAMLIAIAVVELVLPRVNAFLDRGIGFDYLHDPQLLAAMAGTALATALIAGLYPALVLSAFRPVQALKGGVSQTGGSSGVRQVLVVAQFAILISLIVMTATIYRQTMFALNDSLRLKTDQVLRISARCDPNFKHELAALPGVESAGCSTGIAEFGGGSNTVVKQPNGTDLTLQAAPVDVGFFEMHGLKPLAGRFFANDHGQDVVLEQPQANANDQPNVVLNESAARVLGYRNPREAVGKSITWTRWSASSGGPGLPPLRSSHVVGVVRDFTLGSIRTPISPTLYFIDMWGDEFVVVRLDGRQLPETLASIDRLWKSTGHLRPIDRTFESQAIQNLYRDVVTQGVAIAVCAGLAILIACLGLFALAAFTTERRTKEIGVRKAMGASTFDVVRLLLWQFTQPVLWANLIAWPLAWWAMRKWLDGFAYRVDLPVWLFLAAAVAAVAIAWLTVSVHSWLVARARPVTALRYE